jgi:biopolymer transport protein ExbD
MTPFVDVAFLILSFFIMATKFKPPQPVEITTPKSVSADKLKEQDALLIELDDKGRVFMTVNTQRVNEETDNIKKTIIRTAAQSRNIPLTDQEIQAFARNTTIGVPFAKLKSFLAQDDAARVKMFEGIPVTDSTNNELQVWIAGALVGFRGHALNLMIKGDNNAKFPSFKGVIEAMRRNDQFKYQLVTDPEGVPLGSDLYRRQEKENGR